jgi:phenylpropionate dioxygenase-like ring-hydroxylating dioxygenase large terminal subunit
MSSTPGFDPAGCGLPRLRSEVWEGFVFVSFDPDAPALGPALRELAALFRNYDLGNLKTVGSVAFDMDCGWNWKLMCENFMEPYHHIGPHRQSLEPLMPARRSITLDPEGPYAVVHMRYREGGRSGEPSRDPWGASALPVLERLSEDERNRATLIHIFPTGLLTLLPDHVEFYRLFPEGPNRIRLEELICFPPGVETRPVFETEMAATVLRTIHRRGDAMHSSRVKQVKEIILVSDDVDASRWLYRETLGLDMPGAPDRLNLAAVGSQYLGVAAPGVMAHPGFTGRLHLDLEVEPADFERAAAHLRAAGIAVTIQAQRPGYMDTPESVGAYFLDPDANLVELWAPGAPPP